MDTADVLIVGGGPAGSTVAWRLGQAGLRVQVLDAAVFPRDKVCAGWITPPVIAHLQLDVDAYRRGRTFQPITGFRVGVIGRGAATQIAYAAPVSYGIRRCEFDHYLLQRSGARVAGGELVRTITRRGGLWVVNGAYQAPILVGAGGHFCPVARHLNPTPRRAHVVAAREAEQPAEPGSDPSFSRSIPEIYFHPDLRGYGWIFRKDDVVNVGFGSLTGGALPQAVDEFVAYLRSEGRVGDTSGWRWKGHAYRLYEPSPSRRMEADGLLLVGDAAGLAYPESGEGILPAIESALLASDAVVRGGGYEEHLRRRFGSSDGRWTSLKARLPPGILAAAGRELIRWPWFVRRIVLDRWFLHADTGAREAEPRAGFPAPA